MPRFSHLSDWQRFQDFNTHDVVKGLEKGTVIPHVLLVRVYTASVESNWTVLIKSINVGTSPAVQWLRLHTPDTGVLGLILDQGTRSHMPLLRPKAAKFKKKKV